MSGELLSWTSEVGTFEDATLKLANGDPVLWVALKDHAKNAVQFIRQRQNALQEFTVPGESLVCGIFNGSMFPWVTSTCQVDKYNTKGPYVVGGTSV